MTSLAQLNQRIEIRLETVSKLKPEDDWRYPDPNLMETFRDEVLSHMLTMIELGDLHSVFDHGDANIKFTELKKRFEEVFSGIAVRKFKDRAAPKTS